MDAYEPSDGPAMKPWAECKKLFEINSLYFSQNPEDCRERMISGDQRVKIDCGMMSVPFLRSVQC
jgi:hypothetical protein